MKYYTNLAFLILLLFAAAVHGGERQINTTVDGIGTIVDGNVADAKKSAIGDALKKAVEQAVQTIVSSTKIAQNYALLDDNIYSKSQEYTANYKVISEKSVGNIYQITLETRVSTSLLEENLSELGLITSKRNIPRVLVMIVQEGSDGSRHLWWGGEEGGETGPGEVESIIISKLVDGGYVPANKADVPVSDEVLSIDSGEKPGEETFALLASRYNSDMVLYGRAFTMEAREKNEAESDSVHAVVSFSLIDGKNGQTVAASENEELSDRDEIKDAFIGTTEVLAERVMKQITAFWQNNSNTVKTVEINISGIKSYLNFMTFQDALKNKVKGVKEVRQKGFGAGGMATLDIVLKGNIQSLADDLTMISYEGFSIDITEMGFDKISVKMKKL